MNDINPDLIEIFPWNDNFETGIAEIDQQHQELVNIINELASHLVNDSQSVVLNQYFDKLANYTLYHFSTEEKIWEKYFPDDPWLDAHEHTHGSFINDINALKERTQNTSVQAVIQDVVSFLTNWLAFHILDTDKRMAIVVLEMKKGASLEEAKLISEEIMSGTLKLLVKAVLSMYEQLTVRAMAIMREKHLRQKVEAELILAKEKAEASNKIKSSFLASMSHELRTPMHAVISFANLGLKKTDDEKIKHYFQNIRTSGIRLTSLLNDLLDLSKLESGKMAAEFIEQDLSILIQHVLQEMTSLTKQKKITIGFEADRHLECMIDQKLITQVLVNVLSNAIKFSPENSNIEIRIVPVRKKSHNAHKDYFQISIIDQGIGIPESEFKSIFDKFHQVEKTRSKYEGTGLGLSISKEIIDLHKGEIWIVSPPEEQETGTAVYIEIPKIHNLIADYSISNINDAIEAHKKWISVVDEMFSTQKAPSKAITSTISNSHLCSLGQWIDAIDSPDEDFITLKQTHYAFHESVGECFANFELKNFDEANRNYTRFNEASQKILTLLNELRSKMINNE